MDNYSKKILLATCYQCGHKYLIKDMVEEKSNIYACKACNTKHTRK